MHGASGAASQAPRVALRRYVPYLRESLGYIRGTHIPSTLRMVEYDAFQPRRTSHSKYHEP